MELDEAGVHGSIRKRVAGTAMLLRAEYARLNVE
jgi:hypothetical protein